MPGEGVTRRLYCPTSFLADEDSVHQLTAALSNMVGEGVEWWDAALMLVKKVALEYHCENCPKTTDEQQLLHFVTTCSRIQVSEAGLQLLRDKGYAPGGPPQGYTLVVALDGCLEPFLTLHIKPLTLHVMTLTRACRKVSPCIGARSPHFRSLAF